MSDSTHAGGPERPHVEHLPEGEEMRRLAHELVDRLPLADLKAAVIALQELEVSARMHGKHESQDSEPGSLDS